MLELRRARFADAVTLAPRLRFADAREIATQWGLGAGAWRPKICSPAGAN
jgi:hypothetical protein